MQVKDVRLVIRFAAAMVNIGLIERKELHEALLWGIGECEDRYFSVV